MSFVFKRLFLVALCVTLLGGMSAMAEDDVVASPITGRLVTEAGSPLSGVTVTRTWTRDDETGSDTSTTDANGRFAFALVTRPSKQRWWRRPVEPAILTIVSAEVPSGEVVLMRYVKGDTVENGEHGGRPIYVECRSDIEPNGEGYFFGTCRTLDNPPG